MRARRAATSPTLRCLPSPITPWQGAPLRVLFAAEKPLQGELTLIAPDGSVAARSRERMGGPPYSWIAEVATPLREHGGQRSRATAPAECGTITREITVRAEVPPRPRASRAASGRCAAHGSAPTENLFSAWIEKLFDAPLDAALSWPALHVGAARPVAQFPVQPSRPRRRRDEDDPAPRLRRPAVFPARLFRLQDGPAVRLLEVLARRRRPRRRAARGGSTSRTPTPRAEPDAPPLPPPRHRQPSRRAGARSAAPPAPPKPRLGARGSFGDFHADRRRQRALRLGAHRARPTTTPTIIPCRSARTTLRPGTVYADPYGHILMLVKRVPQTEGGAGVFLAVDGAARRHGRAQALLARQLPVRAGSRARRPRLQALPPGRARHRTACCGG